MDLLTRFFSYFIKTPDQAYQSVSVHMVPRPLTGVFALHQKQDSGYFWPNYTPVSISASIPAAYV